MSRMILRSVFGSMALTGVLVMATGTSAQDEEANSQALEVHAQAIDSDTAPADHGWQ